MDLSESNNLGVESIPLLTDDEEQKLEKNLVWIFAAPRSGTTWLAIELLSYQTQSMDEPYIGTHLAGLFGLNVLGSKERAPNGRPIVVEQHKNRPNYFFSDKYENLILTFF